jgi:hypothetical protein
MVQYDLPNYNGNSIVNLMSSIITKFGGNSIYSPLKMLDQTELDDVNDIVLLVFDGLGYKFLEEHGKHTFMFKNLKGKITSVFPTTTAAAMTSFYTGLAPHNHGVPAWFTYLKELGLVSTILPMTVRGLDSPIINNNFKPEQLLKIDSLFDIFSINRIQLLPKELQHSKYNDILRGEMNEFRYYTSLPDFFQKILNTLKEKSNSPRFILGYWPLIDALSHIYGTGSIKTLTHLEELDKLFQEFITQMKKSDIVDTRVIVTADHGLTNALPEHNYYLKDHPVLQDTLTLPLSGEARTPFFYVRPSKVTQFENYIENNLSHAGVLHKSQDLISKGYFGKGTIHPRLFDRIGDYIFIMEDDYTLRDELLSDEKKKAPHKANHGSLSDEELYVPLIEI